jgi:hypothetical protein
MSGHKFAFLARCSRLQTVCERSATPFAWREGVQQFVNEVQQIVIAAANEVGSQATKNPVVEHKGSVERSGAFLIATGVRSVDSAWDKIGRVFDKCSTLGFQ